MSTRRPGTGAGSPAAPPVTGAAPDADAPGAARAQRLAAAQPDDLAAVARAFEALAGEAAVLASCLTGDPSGRGGSDATVIRRCLEQPARRLELTSALWARAANALATYAVNLDRAQSRLSAPGAGTTGAARRPQPGAEQQAVAERALRGILDGADELRRRATDALTGVVARLPSGEAVLPPNARDAITTLVTVPGAAAQRLVPDARAVCEDPENAATVSQLASDVGTIVATAGGDTARALCPRELRERPAVARVLDVATVVPSADHELDADALLAAIEQRATAVLSLVRRLNRHDGALEPALAELDSPRRELLERFRPQLEDRGSRAAFIASTCAAYTAARAQAGAVRALGQAL